MNIKEYYEALDRHDWFFEYSDCHRTWKAGSASYNHLKSICGQSDEHKELFIAFRTYHFSGPAWDTEKQPKPVRKD